MRYILMKNTRLESNINENIVEEEIQLLTEMLLEGTKKITSTVTLAAKEEIYED